MQPQPSTTKYRSRVLDGWLATRPGAAERAGVATAVKAMLPENGTVANLNIDELARALGAATLTASGVPVTPEVALRVTTVYGCVALIAGAIATLPLPVYERIDWETRKEAEHDYWWFLNEKASDGWSAAVAMEYLISAKLFYGDGFGIIERPNNFTNKATGWKPLHPSRVEPFLDSQNGLHYRVTARGGKVTVYDPADILHVPSLGFDGLRSPSPITYSARESIGMSLAAQEYKARFFSQGSTHDIAITAPRKLTDDQLESLRKSYIARHGGGHNARVPLILSGGLEIEKLSITPQDAQLVLLEQFNVEEICRVFGVPPFMVGAMDKTTSWGSGVENMGINFVKYALRRQLGPIQQEYNLKLWPNREKYFVEFNVASLERGDTKTRNEAYRAALGGSGVPGYLTADEIRRLENYPPAAGGDKLFSGAPDTSVADAAKAAATAATSIIVRDLRAEISGLSSEMKALRERPEKPSEIHVDARTSIESGAIAMHAAPVNVDATTTVEAGAIKLDQPITNHVAPAQLSLDLKTYPKVTHETFERDENGELKAATRSVKED